MPPRKAKQIKKDKSDKTVCSKCGETFPSNSQKKKHESKCTNSKPFLDMQALNSAWNALTPEQQAEYGTKEELHNACMEMIEKLKNQGAISTCQDPTCQTPNCKSTCQSTSEVSRYNSGAFQNIAIRQKISHHDPETDDILHAISDEIMQISRS